MCGIAGIVGPAESALPQRDRVQAMIRVMRQRGPDAEGVWASRETGVAPRTAHGVLGACRLAILDLSPLGHQPLIDPPTGSTIVFNGEIYNFGELRRRLVADGVELRSHSDTEVVLQLYLKHGPSCLLLLEGMFAVAIWDARSLHRWLRCSDARTGRARSRSALATLGLGSSLTSARRH